MYIIVLVKRCIFTWVESLRMFRQDSLHQNWVSGEEDGLRTTARLLLVEGRLCVVGLYHDGEGAVRGEAGVPPELAGR